ncbi:MAG: outer membrane lipoprotein-sorting protein [Bacillota bacterium]|nr:outer membrane lipoprotein-sorting protein [Bacillota bacterium]
MPAVGRATPLPPALRSVPFLGGDLSYEELGQLFDRRGYRARVVGGEELGGAACHVLELVPRQAAGPYSRVRLWIEKERFLPRRAEFYQQEGRLWKILRASFPQRIAGRWVLRRLELENLLEQRRTSLEIVTLRFCPGFPDAFFTPQTLERGMLP